MNRKKFLVALVVTLCALSGFVPTTALADGHDNRIYHPEGTWIAEDIYGGPWTLGSITPIGHGMYNFVFHSSSLTRTDVIGTMRRSGHNQYEFTSVAYVLDSGGAIETVAVNVGKADLVADGVMNFSPNWGLYTPDQDFLGGEPPNLGCFPFSGIRYLRIDPMTACEP